MSDDRRLTHEQWQLTRSAIDRLRDAHDVLATAADQMHAAELDAAAGGDLATADEIRVLRDAVDREGVAVHRVMLRARARLADRSGCT